MQLDDFVTTYPPGTPIARPNDSADMFRLLGSIDGVESFPACVPSMAPAPVAGDPQTRHLWVITDSEIPVILELAPNVQPPPLSNVLAKHTNLTGGAPACCGGEIWVDAADARRLFVHGGSGRYPARSPEQLEDVVRVFESFGFEVVCAGWSTENDCAERTF